MKTNLTRFPIIWVKKGQKAGFFSPDQLENHTSQGKGSVEHS